MSTDQGTTITNAILRYLQENPEESITMAKLADVVEEKIKIRNPIRVRVVANALIASKTVEGKANLWLKHKGEEAKTNQDAQEDGEQKMEEFDMEDGAQNKSSGFSDLKESAYKTEAERLRKEIEAYKENLKTLAEAKRQDSELKQKQIAELVKELEAEKGQTRILTVQVKRGGKTTKTIEGVFHNQFEKVLKLAQARMNVFIYGPTGCGKSHLCKQISEALDLRYAFVSCTAGMGESTLAGRLLPIGKGNAMTYVVSEFIECFENGGLFLLDEMDAADPNVLLLINSALANGRVAVTNRPGKLYSERHPDFVCIAAANTIGTGADRMYSGRNKLDASTLDRFSIGKVHMDYDTQLEEQLCPDSVVRNVLLSYRKKIEQNRLERAMSTRFMRDAYIMKSEHGYTLEDINHAFFMGWREDEIGKVKPHDFSKK